MVQFLTHCILVFGFAEHCTKTWEEFQVLYLPNPKFSVQRFYIKQR